MSETKSESLIHGAASCLHNGRRDWCPLVSGLTCGGLALRGWDLCHECGSHVLPAPPNRPVPCEIWRVAKSLRSVETGIGRVRTDGGDAEFLASRIVHVPDLEELRAIVEVFAKTRRFVEAVGDAHHARVMELLERTSVAPPKAVPIEIEQDGEEEVEGP